MLKYGPPIPPVSAATSRSCFAAMHAPGKTESKAGGKGSQVKEITEQEPAAMKKITAEHEDWSEQSADEGSWVFALSAHESMQKQKADLNSRSWRNTWKADKDQFEESLISIDSGSDEHVCGYAFAPLAPTRETTNKITMRDAQGNEILHEHQRDVKVRMEGERGSATAVATFEVADVKGAILSAGKLVQKGFNVMLSPTGSYLERGGSRVELVTKKNSFYLPARVCS